MAGKERGLVIQLEGIRSTLAGHDKIFGESHNSQEALRTTVFKHGQGIARIEGKVEGHMDTAKASRDD